MKYSFFVTLLILFNHSFLLGQSTPKFSNEFLNIGVGARALAMGNAQIANVSDVTAGYWNPAGLLDIETKYEASFMHAEYFAGIAQYDYGGFATQIDSNTHLGVTAIRFGIDDIPDTRFLYDADGRLNYDNVRFFSAADYAFLFSLARRLKFLRGLQVGGSFKVIYRNAGNFANAWGFGLDFGAKLKRGKWQFAVMARDVTSTFNAWSFNTSQLATTFAQTGNELPTSSIEITLPRFIIGISKKFDFNKNLAVLLATNFVTTFDGQRNTILQSEVVSLDPNIGLEIGYKNTVFLRGGVNNIQEIKNFDSSTYQTAQLNFGVGFKIKKISIDYALSRTNVDTQEAELFSNIFSVKLSL